MTLEDRLRDALRPVDPGDAFADRVLARLAAAERPAAPAAPSLRAPRWAIAATVLLTVGAGGLVHHQRERQRAAAAQQLTFALAVTSTQLNLIHSRIDIPTLEVP